MPASAELSRGIGDEIRWSEKVNPYRIAAMVGDAKNIHVADTGRYHVYWHREYWKNGRVVRKLIHHGGRDGFSDLNAVKGQHERVILRYTGMTIEIPSDQTEIGVAPDQNFPQLAKALTLEIPGEQQIIGSWIKTLQDVSRDLPQTTNHGKLTSIRDELAALLSGKLSTSINRHKSNAARTLETGLKGNKGELLMNVNKAQLELLIRAQEAVRITLGTMQRYNDLEKLQISWNGIVYQLPVICANAIRVLSPDTPAERIERVMNLSFVNPEQSIQSKLEQLKGEPYFNKAERFIHDLSPVKSLWQNRQQYSSDYKEIITVLTKQAFELEIWKRKIHDENEGVNFRKYSLEKS